MPSNSPNEYYTHDLHIESEIDYPKLQRDPEPHEEADIDRLFRS